MIESPISDLKLGALGVTREQLEQIDLKDLMAYLKTGESPKYSDQPILGRWEVDPYLTLQQEKRRKVGMTSQEMRQLRQNVEMIKGFKLVVAPDNSAKLKGPDVVQLIKRLADAARAAMEAAQAQARLPARLLPRRLRSRRPRSPERQSGKSNRNPLKGKRSQVRRNQSPSLKSRRRVRI